MRRIVANFIDVASGDGWRQPIVDKDEVNSGFLSLFFCVARCSSRFALAYVVSIANISPPVLFEDSHGCGEDLKAAVEVTHDELGSWLHGVKLCLNDGKKVIGPGRIGAALLCSCPTVHNAAYYCASAGIEANDLASPVFSASI